jgi:hypothetical protein
MLMTTSTMLKRQRAVTQTLASWAIEGYTPDAAYLALLRSYANGDLTLVHLRTKTDVLFGVPTPSPSPRP